jgi:hypothetical protein
MRRRYLAVVPKLVPTAPLIVRRRSMVVVPRPLFAAPRRYRSRRRTTRQMYSGAR